MRKWERKRGKRLYHPEGCKGRFEYVGFYKKPYDLGTRYTYRCQCSEINFYEYKKKEGGTEG